MVRQRPGDWALHRHELCEIMKELLGYYTIMRQIQYSALSLIIKTPYEVERLCFAMKIQFTNYDNYTNSLIDTQTKKNRSLLFEDISWCYEYTRTCQQNKRELIPH